MPQVMKIPDAKAAVDKEWKNLKQFLAWDLRKVKSKMEVVMEAQRDNIRVHFASLMGICHLKNAELELKLKKKKETLLRPILEPTQSSLNKARLRPQMTAAKKSWMLLQDYQVVMGQAADAVSAYTQVKFTNPNVQMFGYVFPRHKNG